MQADCGLYRNLLRPAHSAADTACTFHAGAVSWQRRLKHPHTRLHLQLPLAARPLLRARPHLHLLRWTRAQAARQQVRTGVQPPVLAWATRDPSKCTCSCRRRMAACPSVNVAVSTWCTARIMIIARAAAARRKYVLASPRAHTFAHPNTRARKYARSLRTGFSVQPFCDDVSHEGTGFEPLTFICDKKQTYYLLCGWCVPLFARS